MITKKICLLGSFAVGKTSLVRQFVEGIFSEKYHTTIGVKIDKKRLLCADQEVQLMIWDIEGRDEFSAFRESYLRGATGFFLVVDCTRPDSLQVAEEILDNINVAIGPVPFIVLLNKSDLVNEIRLEQEDIEKLQSVGWELIHTSAKTGVGVEEAFYRLTEKMLADR